jgi:hypothetical protein
MITITELFSKIILTEEAKRETIMHLPHVVERAILGKPHEAIAHLENGLKISQNIPTEGSISDKADGGMSIEIKKGAVKYKGKGEWVNSPEEIDKEYAPHFKNHLMAGLNLAHHPDMQEGVVYQADTLLQHPDHSNLLKGNILSYKKPRKSVKYGLAVHTVLDENTGKKIESAPDLRHMETKELFLPYLGTKGKMHSPKPEEITAINHHISQAKQIFSDPDVARVVKGIARHRDDSNKQGHRHLFIKQFNNAFQRGDFNHFSTKDKPVRRSTDLLMHFTTMKLANAKSSSEKNRILGHLKYIGNNALAIHKMLEGHAHIDEARKHIVNITKRTPSDLHPVNPETGKVDYSMGEGKVSYVPGIEPVKFVESSFTSANAAQSAAAKARKKNKEQIQENEGGAMMTASSGAISGMGYNLGGPAPDDVAVAPLENKMASKKAKPFRRKLMRKIFNTFNLGKS